MKSSVAGWAAALLLAAGVANAQVTNGSFESPLSPASGFTEFAVGSVSIPGWTVAGPPGTAVAIVSTAFAQNGVTFEAQSGGQWLDLTGAGSNSSEGVSQTVTTVAEHQYQLTFFVGNTTGGSVFGTTSTVNVAVNGVQSFVATNSTASPTSLSWQPFTYGFVAAGTSTNLAFMNGDASGDNSNGLDNVVLIDNGPVVSSVPEPETYAMMLGGFAALGLVARRRKTRLAPRSALCRHTGFGMAAGD